MRPELVEKANKCVFLNRLWKKKKKLSTAEMHGIITSITNNKLLNNESYYQFVQRLKVYLSFQLSVLNSEIAFMVSRGIGNFKFNAVKIRLRYQCT